MKDVYIVAAIRTPIGSFGGVLANFTAPQLGAIAIKGALAKIGLAPSEVQEVILGNVLTANVGQAPARQAAIIAGLGDDVVCTTINKVCASGTKAIMYAAQSIQLGNSDVVVAGGMESMSNVPFYLDKARRGYTLGHGSVIDGIVKDGLWDVYNDYHMGNAAEHTARTMGIGREQQDAYAIESYARAAKAWANNSFADELIPIEISQRGKESLWITQDEEFSKVKLDKISSLKPVFEKEGTITAANASSLNDGASVLILMSKEKMEALGLKPLAKILGSADVAQEPKWFTTSPSLAIPKALSKAGISKEQVDLYEINEAFSVVSIANNQLLALDPSHVNIWGGAVSLGHPIGCSGARIVTTLIHALKATHKKIGVAGICNGGGGASALVLEV